jgi:hypothetical protein
MTLNESVSAGAVALAALCYVHITLRGGAPPVWLVPAGMSAVFAGWSAYAVVNGGPFGFWSIHTASPWGAQVWMDLLLMAGVAWYALQSRLRAHGINPWPWLALVAATGSIGMLAMLARLLHAEQTTREPVASHSG